MHDAEGVGLVYRGARGGFFAEGDVKVLVGPGGDLELVVALRVDELNRHAALVVGCLRGEVAWYRD
jgi:hypothetical protein